MRAMRAFLSSLGGRNLKIALYGWAATALVGTALSCALQNFFWLRAGRAVEARDPGLHGLFTFFSDLLRRGDAGPALLLSLAGILLACYVVLSIFLSAGTYAVLVHEERSSFINLFNASLEN